MKFYEGLVLSALLAAALQIGLPDARAFGGEPGYGAMSAGVVYDQECDDCYYCDACAGPCLPGFPALGGGRGHLHRREMEAPVYFANAFPEYTLGSPNIWAGYDEDTVLLAPTKGRMPFNYRYWNYQYNENPTYGKKWEKNWTPFGENGYYGGGEFWRNRNPFVNKAGYPGYSGGYGSRYSNTSGRGFVGGGIFGVRAASGGLIGGGFVDDGSCEQCQGGNTSGEVVVENGSLVESGINSKPVISGSDAGKQFSGEQRVIERSAESGDKIGGSYAPAKVDGSYECNYISEFDSFCSMPFSEPSGCCLIDRVRNFFADHTCPIFGGCLGGGCLNGGCLSGIGGRLGSCLNPYGDVYYDCGEYYGGVACPVSDNCQVCYSNSICASAAYPAADCCYGGSVSYDCCEGIAFGTDSDCCGQAVSDGSVTVDGDTEGGVTNDAVKVDPNQKNSAVSDAGDGTISTDPQPVQTRTNPQNNPQGNNTAQTSAASSIPSVPANDRQSSLPQPTSTTPSPVPPRSAPTQVPTPPGAQGEQQIPDIPAAPSEGTSPLQYPIPDSGDSLLQTPNTPAPPNGTGYLQIRVPADAVVYVNGYQTKMKGTDRCFVAQNLEAGVEYEFEISVVVVRQGETLTDTQVTTLFGGTTRNVAMNLHRSEPNVAMNR